MSYLDPITGTYLPLGTSNVSETPSTTSSTPVSPTVFATYSTGLSGDLSTLQIPVGTKMTLGELLKVLSQVQLIIKEIARVIQNQDFENQIRLGELSKEALAYLAQARALVGSLESASSVLSNVPMFQWIVDAFLKIGFLLVNHIIQKSRQSKNLDSKDIEQLLLSFDALIKKTIENHPSSSEAVGKAALSSIFGSSGLEKGTTELLTTLSKLISSENFVNALQRQMEMSGLLAGITQINSPSKGHAKALVEGMSSGDLTKEEVQLLGQLIEKDQEVGLNDAVIQSVLSLVNNPTATINIALETIATNKEAMKGLSDEEIAAILELLKKLSQFMFLLMTAILATATGGISETELFSGDAVDKLANKLSQMGFLPQAANLFATKITPVLATLLPALQKAGLTPDQSVAILIGLIAPSLNTSVPSSITDLLKEALKIPQEQLLSQKELLKLVQNLLLTATPDEGTKTATLTALQQLIEPMPSLYALAQQLIDLGIVSETADIVSTRLSPLLSLLLPGLQSTGLSTDQILAILVALIAPSLGATIPTSLLALAKKALGISQEQQLTPEAIFQTVQNLISAKITDETTKTLLLSSLQQLYSNSGSLSTILPQLLEMGIPLQIALAITTQITPLIPTLQTAGLSSDQILALLSALALSALGLVIPPSILLEAKNALGLSQDQQLTQEAIYKTLQNFITKAVPDISTQPLLFASLQQLYDTTKTLSNAIPQLIQAGVPLETAIALLAQTTPLMPNLLTLGLSNNQILAILLALSAPSIGITLPSTLLDAAKKALGLADTVVLNPTLLFEKLQNLISKQITNEPDKTNVLSQLQKLYGPSRDISSLAATLLMMGVSQKDTLPLAVQLNTALATLLPSLQGTGLTQEQSIAIVAALLAPSLGITVPSTLLDTAKTALNIPYESPLLPKILLENLQNLFQNKIGDSNVRANLMSLLQDLYGPTNAAYTLSDQLIQMGVTVDTATVLGAKAFPLISLLLPNLQTTGLSNNQIAAILATFVASSYGIPVPSTLEEQVKKTLSFSEAQQLSPSTISQNLQDLIRKTVQDQDIRRNLLSAIRRLTYPSVSLTTPPTASSAFSETVHSLLLTPTTLSFEQRALAYIDSYKALSPSERTNLEASLPPALLETYPNVPKTAIAAIVSANLAIDEQKALLDYLQNLFTQTVSQASALQTKIVHRLFTKTPEELRVVEENKNQEIKRDRLMREQRIPSPLSPETRRLLRNTLDSMDAEEAPLSLKTAVKTFLTQMNFQPANLSASKVINFWLNPAKSPIRDWMISTQTASSTKEKTVIL